MADKKHQPKWFTMLLDAAKKKAKGNIAQLAREMDVPDSTVRDWINKVVVPEIYSVDKLYKFIEGSPPTDYRQIVHGHGSSAVAESSLNAQLDSAVITLSGGSVLNDGSEITITISGKAVVRR